MPPRRRWLDTSTVAGARACLLLLFSHLPIVGRSKLPPGQIRSEFIIDESRQIPEMDETNNNAYDVVSPITPGTGSTSTVDGPVAMPSPEPKPTMEQT